jgi:hypothetical protein
MRFIEELCPPALLYLVFIVVQVGLDASLGLYLTAVVKVVMGVAGVLVLDAFCDVDLGIVSWAIMATPFMITALASAIALGMNLDHMLTSKLVESFTPLTADDKKNRDKYVTQLKGGEYPLSSTSRY